MESFKEVGLGPNWGCSAKKISNVACQVHNSLSMSSFMNQTNSVNTLPSYFFKSHFNISYQKSLGFASVLFHSGFLINVSYAFYSALICAICLIFLNSLHFIILIIYSEHKSGISPRYTPDTSSFLRPQFLLGTLLSNTLNLRNFSSPRD
jgi:hypothetical protein